MTNWVDARDSFKLIDENTWRGVNEHKEYEIGNFGHGSAFITVDVTRYDDEERYRGFITFWIEDAEDGAYEDFSVGTADKPLTTPFATPREFIAAATKAAFAELNERYQAGRITPFGFTQWSAALVGLVERLRLW